MIVCVVLCVDVLLGSALLKCNASFVQLLGSTPARLSQKSKSSIVFLHDAQLASRAVSRCLSSRSCSSCLLRLITEGGAVVLTHWQLILTPCTCTCRRKPVFLCLASPLRRTKLRGAERERAAPLLSSVAEDEAVSMPDLRSAVSTISSKDASFAQLALSVPSSS